MDSRSALVGGMILITFVTLEKELRTIKIIKRHESPSYNTV
jgi:hypothetical protein